MILMHLPFFRLNDEIMNNVIAITLSINIGILGFYFYLFN